MTPTFPAAPLSSRPSAKRLQRALWPMIALFAVFSLVVLSFPFGTQAHASVFSGGFFVLMGLAVEWARRGSAAGQFEAGRAALGTAAVPAFMLVVIGVFHFLILNQLATSVLAGLGWIALGLIHLVFAIKGPRGLVDHPLAKAWLGLGIVAVATGGWLVFTEGLGAWWQLGIAGVASFVIAIFWGITAVRLPKITARYNEELVTTR